jgi:hypothetical protein
LLDKDCELVCTIHRKHTEEKKETDHGSVLECFVSALSVPVIKFGVRVNGCVVVARGKHAAGTAVAGV